MGEIIKKPASKKLMVIFPTSGSSRMYTGRVRTSQVLPQLRISGKHLRAFKVR